jgi:phosphoribosyl 1,2-cyclic phosphate phosphodiesterase
LLDISKRFSGHQNGAVCAVWGRLAKSTSICESAFGRYLFDPESENLALKPSSRDIRGQFILLGTGTSVGVPTLGCGCEVCTSGRPRNQRTRSAAVIGLPEGNLLIDTPPDLRTQLLREQIGVVHSVLFTHAHADHIFGLDDLRMFPFYLGHPVPLFAEPEVESVIRTAFSYAFDDRPVTHQGAVPQLTFHTILGRPFEALHTIITPIRLKHGPRFDVLGFRLGDLAYCTDVNAIPDDSWSLLEGLDVLVLGALRHRPHPTHFCLEEAIAVSQRLRPRRTIFTHMSHALDYDTVNAELPDGIELGYDGMQIPLPIAI